MYTLGERRAALYDEAGRIWYAVRTFDTTDLERALGMGFATMDVMGDMSPTTSKISEKVTHNFESWSPTILKNVSPTDTHNCCSCRFAPPPHLIPLVARWSCAGKKVILATNLAQR